MVLLFSLLSSLSIYMVMNTIWIVLTILVLLSLSVPCLKEWSMHGKLRSSTTNTYYHHYYDGTMIKLWSYLNSLYISKTHFLDFYVVGSIFTTCISILILYYPIMYKNEQERYGVIITLLLLLIHLYRRVLEQKYLYSKVNDRGLMHISAWILGIGFYILMPLSIIIPTDISNNRAAEKKDNNTTLSGISLAGIGSSNSSSSNSSSSNSSSSSMMMLIIIINLLAQYWQYRSHKELARLNNNSNSKQYGIPNGGLFNYISCPHYTCEIIIYTSLCIIRLYYILDNICNNIILLSTIQPFITCTLFVILNLSVNAYNNDKWYRYKFPHTYPTHRYAIIPFLL